MATTGADAVFIDSNIFVHAINPDSPWHQSARRSIQEVLAAGTTICISPQILRECLVVLTRPTADGTVPSIPDALHNVARIEAASRLLAETGDSVRALFKLVSDFSVAGKNVHDANIVATMIAHGVRRLKTHNVADFQRFKHLIQIEPLIV